MNRDEPKILIANPMNQVGDNSALKVIIDAALPLSIIPLSRYNTPPCEAGAPHPRERGGVMGAAKELLAELQKAPTGPSRPLN